MITITTKSDQWLCTCGSQCLCDGWVNWFNPHHSYKVGIYHIIGFYRKLNLKKLSYLSMTTGKENKARMELRHWRIEFEPLHLPFHLLSGEKQEINANSGVKPEFHIENILLWSLLGAVSRKTQHQISIDEYHHGSPNSKGQKIVSVMVSISQNSPKPGYSEVTF